MSQCLTACNPDLIQGVHETEFDTVTLLNMSNFFKAISDPTRLRIFTSSTAKSNLCRRLSDCVTDDQVCYFSPTTLSAGLPIGQGGEKRKDDLL